MDAALLRARIHEAVDEVIDEFLGLKRTAAQITPSRVETVEPVAPIRAFVYHWPADEGVEAFETANEYRLSALPGGASVIVGWTIRNAWNRDRRRAVVFHRARPDDEPDRWYPWTEFVETDTGQFAAPIPNPERPRAILRESNPLPDRFAGKTIARSDEVFDSIREGASLRLVVDESDEADMVRHGYWVATLRGRV